MTTAASATATITVGPPPPRSHARLWIASALLAVYVGFVLLVTMWPNPKQLEFDSIAGRVLRVLHNFGVPTWFGYDKLEFTANIALFVPLGLLLGLVFSARFWWVALPVLPGFSIAIELTQGLALEDRVATVFDVIANTIGGWTGLFIAIVLRALIHARDQTIIEREIWERNAAYVRARRELAERGDPEPPDLLATQLFAGLRTESTVMPVDPEARG